MATQALMSPKFLIKQILCRLYSFKVNCYNQKARNACLRVLVSAMRFAHGLQGVPPL